jgi:hypothetical protein
MSEIVTGQDGAATEAALAEEGAKVEAARAELYDETAGQQGQPDGLILGKYRSTEDLAAAYQNLQAEYSRLKNGQAPASQSDPAPEQFSSDDTAQPEQVGTDQGGIDPTTAASIRNAVLEQAGGEAEYQRLASWAASNLPSDRTNAYNAALASGDQAAVINSLKGLQYDYMMKNGYEPKLTGGRAPTTEVRGYQSERQVIEAMNDPRYSGASPDPAYVREVERRLAVSNVFQER